MPALPARGTTRSLVAADRAGGLSGTVRRSVLPGGLRVVTEAVPGVRSASFGIWVAVGSRDEPLELAGASHFLEHLLFKGTAKRDALAIAAAMDAVGGESNAFTSKEYTCYYARVLDTDLPLAVDVVTDMVTASLLRPEDVESERGVVLEEIAMHDDDPGDVVHDAFAEALYGDAPLGRPIIGTVESIEGLARDAVDGWYRSTYVLPRMVVTAAGRVDHEEVLALVETGFGRLLDGAASPAPLRPVAPAARVDPGVVVDDRPTEQAHLVLGMEALRRDDPARPALQVLSSALGGGMSSRLFQEVREKRGLAYSVYAFASSAADSGSFGVYAGCSPDKVDEVLDLCREELAAAAADGITDEELARAKGQLRGSLVLGLEDTGSRMSRLGKGELVHEQHLSPEEELARLEAVTLDDVRAVARDVLARPLALGVIGPFPDRDFEEAVQ